MATLFCRLKGDGKTRPCRPDVQSLPATAFAVPCTLTRAARPTRPTSLPSSPVRNVSGAFSPEPFCACGFRAYRYGELTDADDASLEYDDEDEDGWSGVIGPDWLIDNNPHYGG